MLTVTKGEEPCRSTPRVTLSEPLFVGRPNIGSRARLMERIGAMLDRRWFTNDGPLVREFEQAVAVHTGAAHCVVMCNATIAMSIAAQALELAGEVIVPAYTFVATAHAFRFMGITPVFADIDPRTHNLDPEAVEPFITPRTSAIVATHLWGRACDVESLVRIGDRHGIPVMFDAAHAFGCSHGGQMIGGFGRCEVFSFHATKFINSFEGGAVTTNDAALADRMRLLRNFGFSGYDNVIHLGTNGKMPEVCAAMGLTSLEAAGEIVEHNRRNYESYCHGLDGMQGVTVIHYDPTERNNYQYVVIEVDPDACAVSRDTLVDRLHEQNVIARRYFWPGVHNMEPYRSERAPGAARLPHSDAVAKRVVVLPTGQQLDETGVAAVCRMIRALVEGAGD